MSSGHVSVAAVLLMVSAALCSAQTITSPRAVLEQIAASERAARVWHAEGVETSELVGEGMNLHTEIPFKAFFRDPSHVRWETTGDNRTLMVCDGADHWTYSEPGTGFYRTSVETSPCRSPLPAFAGLLDDLVSVTLVGADHIPFEGAARDCDLVRAEYRIPAPRTTSALVGTTMIRTMCIDPAHRLILRDRVESWTTGSNTRSTRTITFSSYERDVEIQDEAFRFEPPTGVFLDPGPAFTEEASISAEGIYRVGGGVSRPQLVEKVEPSLTDEARQAGIWGLVLVSLAVDAEGNPRDLMVTRGLGYGLDEKALDAVRQWRFRSGMKDGMPVAVGNLTVAVNFRMPS